MGYPGWLWSQGMKYQELENARREIVTLEPDEPRLVARYGIDYVVLGRDERELGASDEAFGARYPCVIRTPSYRVYAVSAAARARGSGEPFRSN